MKVLHILYRLMPSGAEKMLADSAEMFRSANVEGEILVNDSEEGVFAPTLKKCGYPVHVIPYNAAGLHLLKFWRICRAERYDAVHIHVIRGFASLAWVARLAGVKHIVKTFHGMFTPRNKLQKTVQGLRRRLAGLAGTRFVAISRSVQENEMRTFGCNAKLVWNFADETGFPIADVSVGERMRNTLGIPDDAFVLLSVGNCHSDSHYKIKNHSLVINALAKLPDMIRRSVVYVHVGAEKEGFPERKLANELGVAANTRFLGPRNDIFGLLCAANVYVMSSLHEGLGISAIEAAFAGREMILTNVQGLKDFGGVIRDGITYCELTPESMAKAIQEKMESMRLAAVPNLSRNLSIREDALKTFSMKVGVAELVKLYSGRV